MPLGYYTRSTHSVALNDVADLALAQSGQWPEPIPAILLGRLAIAEAAHGRCSAHGCCVMQPPKQST